jgi:Winged helix DNA-binding domain
VRLTPAQTNAVVEAIAVVLADAELTIDELSAAVIAATGRWAGDLVMPAFQGMWPRWRQAMDSAANRGVLCFGPNRGRYVTYTNPHRWWPAFRPTDGRTTLAALVRNYLHAYGPATSRNFAQWLAVSPQWANELFDSLANELQQVEVDGTHAWVMAGDTKMRSAVPQGVRLLPYFDAYVVGCQPREQLFPGRATERALAGGQAGNYPVLLIDGIVAGVWHQRRTGRKITVTVEPLTTLMVAQRRALDDQVERLGAFLEGAPELTIGIVSVGAHPNTNPRSRV